MFPVCPALMKLTLWPKTWETFCFDRKLPCEVLIPYDRPVSFQVQSLVFYGLLWSDVGVLKHGSPASGSQQEGKTIGQVWK